MDHSSSPRLLLTVEAAADRLGIGRTTMYALVSARQVESVTVGRLRRVPLEALGAYVAALRSAQSGGVMPGTRQPNGASSIYEGKDGDWHGRVTVGIRDDGKPDRRHVQRKTKAAVIKRVRELERDREKGSVRRPGRVWTVTEWLTHWVDNIASATVGENALSAYRSAVNVHLIPGVGSHKLTSLQPEHLERLYAKMLRAGSKPATAHQADRTIRASLNEAVRRGHLIRNPAVLAKAPPASW